jgi:4-hydroxythreonine-4-phosphate dehydrogenase
VAGLNPHSGEGGLFGDEEIREITPAIEAARAEGYNVAGPVPPDTVFFRMTEGQYDAVVAMYHDQGHIPTKVLSFDEGVNVTLGLPIIRTSVDHGTVFGKAGKGTARPASMIAALRLAAQMASGRR